MARRKRELVPDWAGQFDTLEDWVHTATWAIGEKKCPVDSMGRRIPAVCVDAQGRRCQVGGDFHRAKREGAFPVRYFWHLKTELR